MTIANELSVKAVEATAHEKDAPSERKPFKWTQIPLHVLLIAGAVLMAAPFVWMIASSFKPLDEIFARPPAMFPKAPTLVNYETAFGTGTFFQAFFNSFYIATVITVISLLTCAMAAYAFARIRFPGSGLLFGLFLATMMVPIQLTIIPLYTIMGWFRLVDTHASIILPAALFNAFGVFLLRQYVRGIPLELEEAAAIDGASRVKIFITIILPLLRTPMVALGIFIFLGQWNNFFYPLIFLNTDTLFTLPLWVNQFKGQYLADWGGLMAAASLAAIPFLIIFIVAQRQIVEGIALSGSKT